MYAYYTIINIVIFSNLFFNYSPHSLLDQTLKQLEGYDPESIQTSEIEN